MITFGQGLYNLTDRDRATLYVDSFFRRGEVTIAAASDTATATLPIPLDRCCYINNVSFSCEVSLLTTWTNIILQAVSDAGTTYRLLARTSAALIGDNATTSGAGVQVVINENVRLLLPPSTKSVSCQFTRSGNTNPAIANFQVNGYLLPPGGIGRLA